MGHATCPAIVDIDTWHPGAMTAVLLADLTETWELPPYSYWQRTKAVYS